MVEAMPERRRLLLLLATWCALRSGELRELRRSDIELGRDEGWRRLRMGARPAGGRAGPYRRDRAWTPYCRSGRAAEDRGGCKDGVDSRDAAARGARTPASATRHRARTACCFPPDRDPAVHLSETTLNGRAAVVRKNGKMVRAGFGWREARRRAGRSDLTLHDLRHTGASMAGEEGASMAELMHRLGHSTPAMAMRYQHSRLDRDRELARRLSARADSSALDPPKVT